MSATQNDDAVHCVKLTVYPWSKNISSNQILWQHLTLESKTDHKNTRTTRICFMCSAIDKLFHFNDWHVQYVTVYLYIYIYILYIFRRKVSANKPCILHFTSFKTELNWHSFKVKMYIIRYCNIEMKCWMLSKPLAYFSVMLYFKLQGNERENKGERNKERLIISSYL